MTCQIESKNTPVSVSNMGEMPTQHPMALMMKFIEHALILVKDKAKFPDTTIAECLAIKTQETLGNDKRLPVFFINRM